MTDMFDDVVAKAREVTGVAKTYKYPRKYYKFLDNLRESGVTNMYGGAPYVAEQFELLLDRARAVLTDWMDNFPLDYKTGVFPNE